MAVRLPVPRLLFTAVLWGSVASAQGESGFADTILPILSDRCFQCHGPDAQERHAGLRLDTREGAIRILGDDGRAAIVPGDAERSELWRRVNASEEDERMPPPESKLSLTDDERQRLKTWIDEGADYEEHWAFVAPERPKVPHAETQEAHPIDAFIGRKLELEGLQLAPEAMPERLIRRLSLDLTGLPPTPEEVTAFKEAYAADGELAYAALVNRLMESPRYGETMALPWLDAARFADTDGYQFDGPRHMWRWRDWVIDAYNAKMPFDQFTIEQLAGDLLPEPTLDQHIATGFNRNHRYNSEAGLVPEEFLLENAVDRVDTTSTLWMGLTVGCARCHDHKYDPISQKDYYQLIAFFNNVPEAGRAIKQGNSEPVIEAPTREQAVKLRQLESELEVARDERERQMSQAVPVNETSDSESLLVDRSLLQRFLEDGPVHLDGKAAHQIKGLDKKAAFKANQRFTISWWMRLHEAPREDAVILSRQNSGSTRPGVEVAILEGGQLRFDLITRWLAGVGRVTTKAPLPMKQGEWVHLSVSNDGSQSARGQHVYVDGKLWEIEVSHNTNSNVGGVQDKRPLMLGGGVRPGAEGIRGEIRDVRVYGTDLWPEEMRLLARPAESDDRRRFAKVKGSKAQDAYVSAQEALDRYRKTLPTVMVMRESPQLKVTHVRRRGVYHDLGERVERDVPEKFPRMRDEWSRDRLGFARWLVASENPLTARVAVNRYWQKYFGTGLVKTAEDFGVRGERPSHPELLDWLATEFVRTGWDVAAMQRLMVTSRTYRQQSRVTADLLAKDPDNRWLARGPRLRLNGQAIRDQALYVSGLLQERLGGPSVSPYQPADLWAEMSMGMRYKLSKGQDLYRRSLYTIWKRTVAPPPMAVFDGADREACRVKRRETNTPLQALTLLNEVGMVESARHFGYRLVEHAAKGGDAIDYGFRCVTARNPNGEERAVLESALEEYQAHFAAAPQEAAKLVRVGDSAPSATGSETELAAHTALANVLFNLDEAITKE